MLAQLGHQLTQFVVAEKRRGTAAKVQLLDLLFGVEVAGDHLDFLLEFLQVGLGPATVLGDDLVAGAVVANVRAKRHMYIQRQRAQRLAALAQGVEQVERADLAVELHGGRIRRVARSGQVVAADQFWVPTNGVEHAGIPLGWLAMLRSLGGGAL